MSVSKSYIYDSDSDSDSDTGREHSDGKHSDTDSFAFLTADDNDVDSDAESSIIAPSTIMPSPLPSNIHMPGVNTSFERTRSLNDPFIYDTPRTEQYSNRGAADSEQDGENDLLGNAAHLLQRGIYQLLNASNGKAVDLAGVEANMIIGYTAHGDENQQWELIPLGPGYAIRSVYNGSFMSISAPSQSSDLVTSQYPVSWQMQEYSPDEGQQAILKKDAMYRIRWPGGVFVLELCGEDNEQGLKKIKLAEQNHTPTPSQLWKFALVRSLAQQDPIRTPRGMAMPEPGLPKPQPQFSKTTKTVNGRGEVITTTTTTTTTVVTTSTTRDD